MISEDIAFARFACNTGACKGACCVVGSAGAPVAKSEIPVLNKAWSLLKDELRPQSRDAVADKGLIRPSSDGDFELSTIGEAECVFVQFTESGTAVCSIQKAFYEGRINWPKPISCHLFPIRATTIGAVTYLNFEFVPEICEPAVHHAKAEGVYLSDYIREPLERRFGKDWVDEFQAACEHVRATAAGVAL